jgi:hypothetical protein
MDKPPIKVDIDRDRLTEIVEESMRIFNDYYGEDSGLNKDFVLNQLKNILDSGRVSVVFMIPIPNKVMSDLKIRVDPRRKEILFLSSFKKKLAPLNQMTRSL